MTFILDTNILIHTLRNSPTFARIEMLYDPYNAANEILISSVSVGELYSIAKQNRWGIPLLGRVEALLQKITAISVEGADLMEVYSDIDAFSQGKHPTYPLGRSALNMGKNDLWIAATAVVFGGTLLTTDKDFDHLHNTFLNVIYVQP